MFYRFNKLSGRLVGSQQLKAMLPQGLRPLVEPLAIVYDSTIKFAPVPVQEMKMTLKPGEYPSGSVPEPLKMKMRKFQEDNGVPVHLKGGTKDYFLLATTVALIAVGLFESYRFMLQASFPKK